MAITERYSGILVHPTSFPSPYGIGDFGQGAYDFVDFLKKSGQKLWQILPLGPTGFGDSPYQAFSAFAGQPLLISPDKLADMELLLPEDLADLPVFNRDSVDYGYIIPYKTMLLKKACARFVEQNDPQLMSEYTSFCRSNAEWLDDYALFMAGKDFHGGRSWLEWEDDLRDPDEESKAKWRQKLAESIVYYKFIQFIFFRQWKELKAYAAKAGIRIIGDIPIFVSLDSADVWTNRKLFQLDSKGYPTVVAGVPPDCFSATGQLWGNPLYDWEYHKSTGYEWWIKRIENQLTQVDFIRIDHFRGFEAYFAIPADSDTAISGTWQKGPDADLFHAICEKLGDDLPIWAEDLGIITDEVEALRDGFDLPGMKVLQFAFTDPEDNDLLPHHFATSNCICYTGTHDNETTLGWYYNAEPELQDRVRRFMNTDGHSIHWDFIRTAMSSIAKYCVFPIQDIFGFGNDCRMNTPSVPAGNWAFRYRAEYLTDSLAAHLKSLTELYGRGVFVEKKKETLEDSKNH